MLSICAKISELQDKKPAIHKPSFPQTMQLGQRSNKRVASLLQHSAKSMPSHDGQSTRDLNSIRQSIHNSHQSINFNQLTKPIDIPKPDELKKPEIPTFETRRPHIPEFSEPAAIQQPLHVDQITAAEPKASEQQTFNEGNHFKPEQQNEDLDDFQDNMNHHMLLEHDGDQLKDLSNPASQDYVFEKLRDMEQNRLNEGSDRYVPKQVTMPDCDGSDDDSEMAVEHPLNFEQQQQVEDSSPFHPDFNDQHGAMYFD